MVQNLEQDTCGQSSTQGAASYIYAQPKNDTQHMVSDRRGVDEWWASATFLAVRERLNAGVPHERISRAFGLRLSDVQECAAAIRRVASERSRSLPVPGAFIQRLAISDVCEDERHLTMREIAEEVAARHKVTLADLKGPQRARKFAWPRQEAMWLMCKEARWSLPQIGRYFGDRDHTTVLAARRRHQARVDSGQA